MKVLSHSKLSGNIFYGNVNEKKIIYNGKKDIINEDEFKACMINWVRHREKDSSEGLEFEVYGRKFHIVIKEIDNG